MFTIKDEIAAYGERLAITLDRLHVASGLRVMRWHPGGVLDWDVTEWSIAVAGELGEAMNVVKKLNRDRDGIVGNKVGRMMLVSDLAGEIADAIIYLDLFAMRVHDRDSSLGRPIREHNEMFVMMLGLHRPNPVSEIAWSFWRATVLALEDRTSPAYYAKALAFGAGLAAKFDIDLPRAIADKFNATSEKYGFPERVTAA